MIEFYVFANYPHTKTLPENMEAGLIEEITRHFKAYGFTYVSISKSDRITKFEHQIQELAEEVRIWEDEVAMLLLEQLGSIE